jgi:hypothetical protein
MFLLGGMLVTVSTLAKSEPIHTGSDSFHLVTINGRQIHSEFSCQGELLPID